MDKRKILLLEGIFDQNTLSRYSTISPAVNFWHMGFIKALMMSNEVFVIGYMQERAWPYGKLFIRASKGKLFETIAGKVIGYINIPIIRDFILSKKYIKAINSYIIKYGMPNYLISFNDSPATKAAKYFQRKFGIKWIFIAGDGLAVDGADGYIIQNWNYFNSSDFLTKIHLDGGLPEISSQIRNHKVRSIMYMGSLTVHGGALQLARAFHRLKGLEFELWLTGRGASDELEKIASSDSRIKLYGFIGDNELHDLCSRAYIFANPRVQNFAPNLLNYPSKLLHYLAYKKPVISTFTAGLSPDYEEILIQISDENELSFTELLHKTLTMNKKEYEFWQKKIEKFNTSHSWLFQSKRLNHWLIKNFENK